jgi:ABC-type branched-subunit amino acid transport system substrate-binding protein
MFLNLPSLSRFLSTCAVLFSSAITLIGCQAIGGFSTNQVTKTIVPTESTISHLPQYRQNPPLPVQVQKKILPPGLTPQLPSFLPLLNGPVGAIHTYTKDIRVPPPATTDTVRISILLPLSGSNAHIGKALLNAAKLALFDFADSRFEMLPQDTKGTSDGAARAARFAISDGASVILGPLFSRSVKAVIPAAKAANVPVIAFSNDNSIAGNGAYTLGFLPSEQVRRVIQYAYSRGITRFGALAPNNAYGVRVVEALQKTTLALGATVTRSQFYDPNADDFTSTVREFADYDARRKGLLEQRKTLEAQDDEISKRALGRLKNLQTLGDLPFEALFVADGGKRLLSVAALLPFFDIDPGTIRMLGTGQWDEPGIGKEPALIGGWYAAPPPSARIDFDKQYLETYGTRPPRLVTMAYDATALIAVLARQEGGPMFTEEALTNPNGFLGRDGVFRLTGAGTAERGLAIMQIGQDKNKVISNAPESFKILVN